MDVVILVYWYLGLLSAWSGPISLALYLTDSEAARYLVFRVGPDTQFGRIPDIEINRPVIQYCRVLLFSLTLLKLSGGISNNLVFYIKQIDIIRPDIRPNPTIFYLISVILFVLLFIRMILMQKEYLLCLAFH